MSKRWYDDYFYEDKPKKEKKKRKKKGIMANLEFDIGV